MTFGDGVYVLGDSMRRAPWLHSWLRWAGGRRKWWWARAPRRRRWWPDSQRTWTPSGPLPRLRRCGVPGPW